MGVYFNPSNIGFTKVLNNQIYVDKSLLIEKLNKIANSNDCYVCFSRPRRFGKSTDAKMLSAYYSKGCDSTLLFNDLKISQESSYQEHLNKYNVIYIDMQYFYNMSVSVTDMIDLINEELIDEINENYHISLRRNKLSLLLNAIYGKNGEQFIFIIDEWDCVLRDAKSTKEDKDSFLVLMNELLKEKEYVALAYMTGILPIKKYGDESAINMFDEISMLDPMTYENYMGFTEDEVKELCYQYDMNFDAIKGWYDGYHFKDGTSIYSPRSIVKAMTTKKLGNYWSKTASFENLKKYISSNYDGLKDAIHRLLIGDKILVDTSTFTNDMANVTSKDDVLTLLIHLGYLAYDSKLNSTYIPNKEVSDSFISVVREVKWPETMKLIQKSDRLLEETWNLDEEAVAKAMEEIHDSYVTSPLKYNNEDALSTTILMAYYTAQDYYTILREMPSGKGFCDIGFIPLDSTNPAMIIELKWNKSVDYAINQINRREYFKVFEHYKDNLLLIGISYESDSRKKDYKHHICRIQKYR
ncbi:MAG: ATP-binding protein [Erysipelotrichaceae bacterium]|nr:ATP-binding protein [Erysipelotrichaceae bacterium]